jgi:hypothetical protein
MSAAELRQAAETLRERAEAANTDEARRPYSDPSIAPVSPEEWGALVGGDYLGGEIGDYCATMHPGVGLALADWLDKAGADWFAFGDEDHHRPEHEPCDYCDDDPYGPHLRSALTIARLINGGAA